MTTTQLRRFWPAAAIAAIVAVTAGVFVWGGREDVARASAGQAFPALFRFDDDVQVASSTLRLPSGGVTIDTTAPQSSAPAGLNIGDRLAPDGGSFVGVWVRADTTVQLPLPADTEVTPPAVSVALLVGSRRYAVPAPTGAQQTGPAYRFAWVAVDGRPRDVSVAVTYDGVTQRVNTRTGARETGAAAPLYRLATATSGRITKSCGTPTAISDGFRVEADSAVDCEVSTLGALPYLPGRGWAEAGRVWFTLTVGVVDYATFERGAEIFRAARTSGSGPVVTAATSTAPTPVPLRAATPAQYLRLGTNGLLAAFAVPAGTTPTLTLTATYRDLAGYIEKPTRTVATGPTARVTWTVTP